MQIVQPEQDLFRDLLDDMCRDSSMLVPLDQPQQVLSQHLEHHANVRPVGSDVPKVIKQLHGVSSSRVVRVGRDELLEELYLVQCGFGVMTIRFDDFERDMLVDPAGGIRRRDSDEQVSVDSIRLVQVSHCNVPTSCLAKGIAKTHVVSLANQTVLKCPHPNFLTITYLPSLNASPICTG